MVDIGFILFFSFLLGMSVLAWWWQKKWYKNAYKTMDGFTCKECGKKYNIKMETEKDLCQKCYDKKK